jgi:prenyltransferase beta subunit
MSDELRPGLEVLRVASQSTRLVEETARGRIVEFIRSKRCDDGGYAGRTSDSDLYYSHFALSCLAALHSASDDPECTERYFEQKNQPNDLDFVHLNALLRGQLLLRFLDLPGLVRRSVLRGSMLGRALLKLSPAPELYALKNIEEWRSRDGGYHHTEKNAERGTAYAAFLAVQARLDHGEEVDDIESLLKSIASLQTPDGGVANTPDMERGTTTATGAAVMLRHYLGADQDEKMIEWLAGQFAPRGGFRAGPQAPIGDLLSTSVGLLALRTVGYPIDELREGCLDFVDTMWQDDGGFCGSMADPMTDVEYTFYGLMTLGCLA